MMKHAAVGFLLLVSLPASAADFEVAKLENWHHWRGPNADGSVPNADPPTKWDPNTNIKWKTPLPGRGSATPIVWGGKVFVLTAIDTGREAKPEELPKPEAGFDKRTTPPGRFFKFVVLCYDRTTGKLLWEQTATERVPHEGHHPSHSYAAGSPTTDGTRLYASFGSFGTYCYSMEGKLLWSRDFGRMNTRLGWGEAVTPVIHGDSLILNHDQEADSKLYCLDALTGETRWAAKRDEKTSWNTPFVTKYGDKTQVIVNGTIRIRSHDLATGEVLWSCGGMTTNAIPSPLRVRDHVVCMSGYGAGSAVAIPLDSRGEIAVEDKLLWKHKGGTPYVPSAALVGTRLYFTQANESLLTVLDALTGKAIIDKERLPQSKGFYASPITAKGRVYFTDQAGTTFVLKDGKSLDILATNRLEEHIDASPVAVGKQLFLRGDKHLFCIEEQ